MAVMKRNQWSVLLLCKLKACSRGWPGGIRLAARADRLIPMYFVLWSYTRDLIYRISP